jgi:hypothetical protein
MADRRPSGRSLDRGPRRPVRIAVAQDDSLPGLTACGIRTGSCGSLVRANICLAQITAVSRFSCSALFDQEGKGSASARSSFPLPGRLPLPSPHLPREAGGRRPGPPAVPPGNEHQHGGIEQRPEQARHQAGLKHRRGRDSDEPFRWRRPSERSDERRLMVRLRGSAWVLLKRPALRGRSGCCVGLDGEVAERQPRGRPSPAPAEARRGDR